MSIRMVDYYVKHLPFDARQDIFTALDQINPLTIEKILEKVKGYPRYRSVGYTDEDIANQLRKMSVRFQKVNELMIQHNRPPLFADTTDVYACSLRFVEIMRRYRERESDSALPDLTDFGVRREMVDALIKIMGCTWQDYVPQTYKNSI